MKKHKKGSSGKTAHADVYQIVTDRIVAALEQGTVVMPLTSQFDSEADYWSTLLHEIVHSTGHRKRLDREGISAPHKKGDDAYALEELIAETGSAFLCAQLGIYGEVQHDSYIDGWLRVLKADKKALFRACSKAREAAEYLLAPLNIRSAA